MTHPLIQKVWDSRLPEFLKKGLASKLVALSLKDGGKLAPWLTVEYLVKKCRYHRETRRLSKRTIQHHLHALQRCGFVEIIENGRGRGHKRTYVLHFEALATVQANDPMLRPAHRRASVLCQQFTEGRNTVPKGVPEPAIAASSSKAAPPPPAHAPPNLIGPIGRSRRRRWDPVRTPTENFAVFTKLADTLCHEVVAAGARDLPEFGFIQNLKDRVASLMPGQLHNTAQIVGALDAAVVRRRMRGLPVPKYAGSNAQTAFARDRSGHARMDAR